MSKANPANFYEGNDYVKTLSTLELKERISNIMCTVSMRILINEELKRRQL